MSRLTMKDDIVLSTLWDRAYTILTRRLEERGNQLSTAHREAVSEMLMCFSKLSLGRLTGRWALGLDAGLGKSQGCVSFIIAAHECADALPDNFSLTICASRIEDLAEMYRDCYEAGVPKEKLGLWYSERYVYDEAVASRYLKARKSGEDATLPAHHISEPRTRDLESRRFIFVTHQRAKNERRQNIEMLTTFNGHRRSLTIWDESFLKSSPWSITRVDLDEAIGAAEGRLKSEPDLQPVVQYMNDCRAVIEKQIAEKPESTVTLPSLEPADRARMIYHLPKKMAVRDTVEAFLTASAHPVRLVRGTQGGSAAFNFQIQVPRELDPVAILDASWRIRYIEQLDRGLKTWPRMIDKPVKSYPHLRINVLPHASGRGTVEDFLNQQPSPLLQEIVHTVQSNTGRFLIVTFVNQRRRKNATDAPAKIRAALEAAGVPPSRYKITTFGMETATSAHKDCEHVLFAGCLWLSDETLRGLIAGQLEDLSTRITREQIEEAQLGEIAHSIYQGANRGASRTVINGVAEPMTAWVMYRSMRQLRDVLSPMLPKAQWAAWQPKHLSPSTAPVDDLAAAIVEYISTRLTDAASVSSRQTKGHIEREFGELASETYKNARKLAMKTLGPCGWEFRGGSFLRLAAVFMTEGENE